MALSLFDDKSKQPTKQMPAGQNQKTNIKKTKQAVKMPPRLLAL
jgi:hypothetical protein